MQNQPSLEDYKMSLKDEKKSAVKLNLLKIFYEFRKRTNFYPVQGKISPFLSIVCSLW